MARIKSINPFNNQLLKEFEEHSLDDLNSILAKSESAFSAWKKTSFEDRKALMNNCSERLLYSKRKLGELISMEMGKPILQSVSEVEKCAAACQYYSEHAESFLKEEKVNSDASQSFIRYEPLGCILAVMPWNFPFWQVFRFAAPALMAGNVALLKHASNVPQCSLAIEKIFKDAGFPDHVFQSVLIGSEKVKYLIEQPVVKATTLTGSEKAGSEVAMVSGKNIKKSVLELGGSDAFIVLKDADMDEAAKVAVQSRMINTGQSCIAAKRFIIVEEVYDAFLEKMTAEMLKLKIGNPMDEKTDLGPLARADLVNDLQEQIRASIEKGARVFWSGGLSEFKGAFMNPVILVDVKPGMPAYEEEFFGPVAVVFKATNEDEALSLANDSKFGLGGSIWTNDISKGISLAKSIESGAVFINGLVKSDPRLPFGGIKKSGYGRELSYPGIREFVNVKTVCVK